MSVRSTPDVDRLLAAGAAVAVGVSGGKDSQAAAIATFAHLDAIRHAGPRVLIHSDLGLVEWTDSMRVCRELAAHFGVELIVTRRKAGGLMERWESRWKANVERYINLLSVTLILPWSTPSMRFCTSELKTHPILAQLRRRFPGMPIVNATGVRWQESTARAKKLIANPSASPQVMDWRPIIHLTVDEVFALIASAGLTPHEGYTLYGSSRISCLFCILAKLSDLLASLKNPESWPLYRRMCKLELLSGFAFQGSRWLCDLAPQLLEPGVAATIPEVKRCAALRVAAESTIPKALLYVKGWPTFVPSLEQGELIASVRRQVGAATGLPVKYTTGPQVVARYRELFNAKYPELAEAA